MGEVIRGWKRKAGLVTLAMTCLLTVGWLRSLSLFEEVDFPNRGRVTDALISYQGTLNWQRIYIRDGWDIRESVFRFRSVPIQDHDPYRILGFEDLKWRGELFGIGLRSFYANRLESHYFTIPYWCLISLLTALSAWFLLSKRSPPKMIDPPLVPAT